MLLAILFFIIVLALFFLIKIAFPMLRFLEKLDAADKFYKTVIYFIAFQFSGKEKGDNLVFTMKKEDLSGLPPRPGACPAARRPAKPACPRR